MDFFKKHLKSNASDITAIEKAQHEDNACYNLLGQRVDESYKGVVIKSDKKYLRR